MAKHQAQQDKQQIRGAVLGSLGLLLLLFFLVRFVFAPEGLPLGSIQPRVHPTPVQSVAVEAATLSLTPAPPPIELSVQREYPKEAVMLVVEGSPLFALESRSEALQLLQEYLQYWADRPLDKGERLLKAVYPVRLELAVPYGQVDLLKGGEAYGRLLKDPSLLPVQRTTVLAKVEESAVESVHRYQGALLQGTRFVPALGTPSFTLIYSELQYRQDTAMEIRETNRFSIGSGGSSFVWEDGTMAPIHPKGTAGDKDYPAGRQTDSLSLIHPVTGKIARYYGHSDGRMHYHLLYETRARETVTAPESGVVIYAGPRGDMGLTVDILHDEKGFISRVYNLGALEVELYQRVKRGERLGYTREYRNSPLCYTLLVDSLPVNPMWYLQD